MNLRHNNSSQLADSVDLKPLLQNENPYYKNINRAPKNAYDYADNINKMLSYGGTVSRLAPAGIQLFNLYDIVGILDGEIIAPARDYPTSRYGIIVTEADADGYYIVCTFCPNFVYPAYIADAITGFTTATVNSVLYFDNTSNTTPQNNFWMTTASPVTPISLGKKTGTNSIFFCGTVRLF